MWTRRISSGCPENPTPRDVIRALLGRLIVEAGSSSWAHFEVMSEAGWFTNLLFLKEPWVEVAYVDEQSLELSLGLPKSRHHEVPATPERWKPSGKGLWTVPIDDVEELTEWVDSYLAAVCGRPEYRVSAWIEGL